MDDPRQSKLTPGALAEFVGMVERRELSQTAAKAVLEELVRSGGDARTIVEAKGLAPISDTGELEAIVERAISADPGAVEQLRAGKQKAIGALVGAVMRETKGRADGAEVQRLVLEKLGL